MIFNVGDKVKRINNLHSDFDITVGKVYKVLSVHFTVGNNEPYISIENDDGDVDYYYNRYFTLAQPATTLKDWT